MRKDTVTTSGASGEPVLRANSRIVGWATVTQIGAVVAVDPGGEIQRLRAVEVGLVALDDGGAAGQRPAAAGLEAPVGGRVVPRRIEPRQERPLERLLGTSGGLGRRRGQGERGQRARDDDQGPSHNFETVP